jgi:hypothetical protein
LYQPPGMGSIPMSGATCDASKFKPAIIIS